MSDDLLDLPEGWDTCIINELIAVDGIFIDGDWVESKDQDPSGDVRLIQLADIGDGFYRNKSNRFLTKEKAIQLNCTFLKPIDVLVARMPDPLGRACIFPGDNKTCVTVVDVCILRSGSQGINQSWLMYTLNSQIVRSIIFSLQSGSTRKRISRSNLAKIRLPLPPLNEQKRIVAKIEELNDRSQTAQKALETIPQLCDRFRQSVLAAAFRGDLTADWREKNPDVEPASVLLERIKNERRQKWEEEELKKFNASGKIPKDDKWKEKYKESDSVDNLTLSELPDTWRWVLVQQFADVGTGATPLRGETKFYENGTIPWITSGALNNLFIDNAEEFITTLAIQETNAKIFPKHTLLVAMYGEGKTRGKVAELLIEAATNQACAALVLEGISYKIQPIVKLFFQKNYNDIRKLASGGVQPNLNLNMIKLTPVPVPPLEEQKQIVSLIEKYFKIIETIEKQHQQATEKLEKLNQSILSKAFRGELVPQDPDDEPASVLLERIRAEREKLNNSKPKSTSKRKGKTPKEQGTIPGLE